jgi:serine-type D-Ala-D-Ala carboxypeptidase/endopeptidase
MRRIRTIFPILVMFALGALPVVALAAAAQRKPGQHRTGQRRSRRAGGSAQQNEAGAKLPPDAAVLQMIKKPVDAGESAGMVVGLVDADGKTRVVAYGDAGPGQPPLDGDSVFEIGSVTKTFTATALAELVQEGKVNLDDPVQKYLPANVHVPSKDGKQITLANLSEQNSGLPRMATNDHPTNRQNPYADYTVEQLWQFLDHYKLTRDPGAKYEYSNVGVGLLGQALSREEGSSYEDMERRMIWQPLGMEHTAITLTPWMKAHLARGHNKQGKVTANWDLPTLAGAGAIRSDVNDMLKYLEANLHTGQGPLGKAMAFAHQERAPIGKPNQGIGLNWFTRKDNGLVIIHHDGETGGYHSFIGFVPSEEIGVVILTDQRSAVANNIGLHLLDPSIPLRQPGKKGKPKSGQAS